MQTSLRRLLTQQVPRTFSTAELFVPVASKGSCLFHSLSSPSCATPSSRNLLFNSNHHHSNHNVGYRQYSTTTTAPNESSAETPTQEKSIESMDEDSSTSSTNGISTAEVVEELRKAMNELETQLISTEEKCKDLQDKLLRSLAENENARTRYRKEIDNAKLFAISKFAESTLEIADNLQRAIDSATSNSESNDPNALLEGVKMTQTVLNNCLSNFGIEPFDAMGQQFNPKLHEALFEMNSTDKPRGTVVQVLKQGYMIKDRVLRPAKVGTAK